MVLYVFNVYDDLLHLLFGGLLKCATCFLFVGVSLIFLAGFFAVTFMTFVVVVLFVALGVALAMMFCIMRGNLYISSSLPASF